MTEMSPLLRHKLTVFCGWLNGAILAHIDQTHPLSSQPHIGQIALRDIDLRFGVHFDNGEMYRVTIEYVPSTNEDALRQEIAAATKRGTDNG